MNQLSPSTAIPPSSVVLSRPNASGVQGIRPATAANAVMAPVRLPATDSSVTPSKESTTQSKYSAEEVKRASDDLKQRVKTLAPDLQFSVDDSTGRSVIKFTDRATQKVIRQFPSEEALHLTKVIDQFQRGLLLSSKA